MVRTWQMGRGMPRCAGDRVCWTGQMAVPGLEILHRGMVGLIVLVLWWNGGSLAWPVTVSHLARPSADPSAIPGAERGWALAWAHGVTDPGAPQFSPLLLPSATAVLSATAQMGPGLASRTVGPDFVRVRTGRIPKAPLRGEGTLIWPIRGTISQAYNESHKAIDIMEPDTDVVVASDAGTVAYASWNSAGYGYLVVVNHGNGLVTYYAHLFGFYVDVGESVRRGQPIGVLGSTGRSTGPHLHFEVRDTGVLVDPLPLLPPG